MRPKRGYRTASQAAWKDFLIKNPGITLSFKDFTSIIRTYNSLLADYLIEEGKEVKLSWGLGTIVITKYKPNRVKKNKQGEEVPNYPIDWPNTRKHGKIIYILNQHTERFKFYFAWFPKKSHIKYSHLWKFKMARTHSRKLAKVLKIPNSPYRDKYQEWVRKYPTN